jgi:hypothetical protein
VESINKANQLAQQRTAVDILNAVILLIKLEGERLNWYKQNACERDNQLLTEQVLELMEDLCGCRYKGVSDQCHKRGDFTQMHHEQDEVNK